MPEPTDEGASACDVVPLASLDALLRREIVDAGVAPAAVVAWARRSSALRWSIGIGAAGCASNAIFDLASVTKPLTAIAAMRACAAGRIDLSTELGEALPPLAGAAASRVTLAALLSHRAGLPAWGALYRQDPWATRAPTSLPFEIEVPTLETILMRAASRCEGAAPRSLYSDIGYVLAGAMVERALGGADALARAWEAVAGVSSAARLRARDPSFDGRVLPTEVVAWRGGAVRGVVHDENAFAIERAGATPGHAGAFGTAESLARLGARFVDALEGGQERWLPHAWAAEMCTRLPFGTHAIGWDTPTPGASSSGTRFGPRAIGHLGFTGTSVWIDPDAHAVAVLLTNRTYPTRQNALIRAARPRVHDALWSIELW